MPYIKSQEIQSRLGNMGTLENSALPRAQEAKLQTNTDDNSELTIHTYADERGMRKEYWRRDKLLGSGGFGTVFWEECLKRVGSGFEHEEEPGPLVRAVKQLQKPRGQASLSGELLRELNALVFFTGRQVSADISALCPVPHLLTSYGILSTACGLLRWL